MKKWIFTKEEVLNNPSSMDGISDFDELRYRQNSARFIHDCGKKLNLPQGAINRGIVLMHRFYMLQSCATYDVYDISTACIFLTCKLEDNLESNGIRAENILRADHFSRVKNKILREFAWELNLKRTTPKEMLFQLELEILQTLGFNTETPKPEIYTEKMLDSLQISGSVRGAANFLTTNALYMTRFCVTMKPVVLAATCIYMALNWAQIQVGKSSDGKHWWNYLDENLDENELIYNVRVYLDVCQKYPARVKDRYNTPNSYLEKLQTDFSFVKKCLNSKVLWNKLSKKEKQYCKEIKKQRKISRDGGYYEP